MVLSCPLWLLTLAQAFGVQAGVRMAIAAQAAGARGGRLHHVLAGAGVRDAERNVFGSLRGLKVQCLVVAAHTVMRMIAVHPVGIA